MLVAPCIVNEVGYRSWESFLVAGAVFGEMRVDSRLLLFDRGLADL